MPTQTRPWERFDADTPEWWLTRLEAKLKARAPELQKHERYFDGDHPLAFASARFKKAFGGLFEDFADNWCELVIDAVEERLNPVGFRFPDSTEGSAEAWRIWQDNAMDAGSQIAHTEGLLHGASYALPWWGPDGQPQITIESPMETIVSMDSQRKRAAALKMWLDDSGYLFATLYRPDNIWKYRSERKVSDDYLRLASQAGTVQYKSVRWAPREVPGETWPLPNKLGVVPVVPLVNRPRLLKPPVSEIRKVIPIQDAVNKELADLLVASEFEAYRQRFLTGMTIPRDPETNEPIEPFKLGVDRLLMVEDEKAKFGEFSPVDLSNYVSVIEMLVQHIASQTRTPPHYFYLSGQMPSGESIKSAETGLVAKARRKMTHFGEAWEEVIRLALQIKGSSLAAATSIETIWRDPESHTEAEHIDALVKKKSFGVPDEQLWEDADYSPTQIARIKKWREEQGTPPEPAPAPTGGGQ